MASRPAAPHADPMPIPTAAPTLTPEDALLWEEEGVLWAVGRADADGVVAAAGLTVLEVLAVLDVDVEDRNVALEGCLVAVLADEAMVVNAFKPSSANRVLPTPVSQQSFV